MKHHTKEEAIIRQELSPQSRQEQTVIIIKESRRQPTPDLPFRRKPKALVVRRNKGDKLYVTEAEAV